MVGVGYGLLVYWVEYVCKLVWFFDGVGLVEFFGVRVFVEVGFGVGLEVLVVLLVRDWFEVELVLVGVG